MKLTHRITTTIIMCITSICIYAQTDMETYWKEMPDSIIPILNKNTRSELIALYKSNDTIGTNNALGGKTRIKKLTHKFINIQLTKASSVQILLLQKNDSTQLLCMQKSFGSPTLESEIAFYSTDWTRIYDSFGLPSLSNEDTLKGLIPIQNDSTGNIKLEKLKSILSPIMARADLSENEGGTLTLYFDTCLLTEDESKALKGANLQKSFKWKNGFFK